MNLCAFIVIQRWRCSRVDGATTSLRERVQTSANTVCVARLKSLQRIESELAAALTRNWRALLDYLGEIRQFSWVEYGRVADAPPRASL
jgi:hypothetical protein